MPRVALIHDFLLDLRGAERVFAAICDAWPDADVFSAVYDEKGTEGRFADRHPQASFLQKLRPTSRAAHRSWTQRLEKLGYLVLMCPVSDHCLVVLYRFAEPEPVSR